MVGGETHSTWNCGSTGPRWSEIADFEPIIAPSTSDITTSEKSSINTNRKSPTHFPMSLRWSSYVALKSPKGGSKTQNGRFPSNIALRLKKVCYKVTLCKKCQRQNFSRPNYQCKSDWWRMPPSTWNLGQTDRLGAKSPIFDLFSSAAPQP